jgi:hypothetical protein
LKEAIRLKRRMNACDVIGVVFRCGLALCIGGCGDDGGVNRPVKEAEFVWEGQTGVTNNTLFAVADDEAGGLFAVGGMGTVVRFGGQGWSAQSVDPDIRLVGVHASAPDNAFAYAEEGKGLYHYDGSSWTFHTDTGFRARDVWCSGPDEVLLLGRNGVYRFDGYSWIYVPVPQPPCDDSVCLYSGTGAMWALSPTEVYVTTDYAYVAHYDGETWELQPTVQSSEQLNDIWGSGPSDIFAVGYDGVIVHFDGTSWSPQESGIDNNIYRVWGSGPSDVYALAGVPVDFVGERAIVLHYDGSVWSPVDIDAYDLNDMVGTGPDAVYAVGDMGNIMSYDGVSWSSVNQNPREQLVGIWGCSASEMFAVGEGGVVMRYDGSSWSETPVGVTDGLLGVGGTGCDNVFAVGYSGTVVHFDGAAWTRENTPATDVLWGVWGDESGTVLAVGDEGTILRRSGESWVPDASPTSAGLRAIWGTSEDDIFAVGAQGTIIHYDGSSWSTLASGTIQGLSGVWGTSPTNVYAVGSLIILHYDGTTWTTVQGMDTDWAFRDIWGSGPDDFFATGFKYGGINGLPGTIIHFDGARWTREDVAVLWPEGIWGDGAGNVYAVAIGGMILKRVEARR